VAATADSGIRLDRAAGEGMAITRFVTYSIILAEHGSKPSAPLRERGNDCAIQLVESSRAAQSQFTLYGYTSRHLLNLPDWQQHPAYDAASDSVTWSASLSSAESAALLALLNAVVVPVMVKSLPGLDGTWYSLSLTRARDSFHFTWWMQPPAGWESLGAVAAFINQVAERTFATSAQESDLLAKVRGQLYKTGQSL